MRRILWPVAVAAVFVCQSCVLVMVCSKGVHRIRTPSDVFPFEPGYTDEHWGVVNFPPVPAYSVDTHDPHTQDMYISGSVHEGKEPWGVFIWDRVVEQTPVTGRGLLFVDVGANLGFFSLAAASLGYRVISFEPMTRNMWKLARSVERNDGFEARVALYQNAVTSRATAMSMPP